MKSSKNRAFFFVLVFLFCPIRSEAQVQTISQSSRSALAVGNAHPASSLLSSAARPAVVSERQKVIKLGLISGTVLGAVGGGLVVHHICANNDPDFGILCPIGVVTAFGGFGGVAGILTGLAIAPTVHGPRWKNVLKGIVIGTVKIGRAHV